MDKVFEVNINGERVFADVSEDGRYSIIFPLRKDKEGNECYEHIERDVLGKEVFGKEMPGLRFTSTRMYDKNYKFTFWVLDDGTMIWKDTDNNPYRSLGKKFDRKAIPETSSEKLAKNIYDTFQMAYEYEKIGMPAEEVGKSRKDRLSTALLLAGYDRVDDVKLPIRPDKSFFSLRRLGLILENYRNLSYVYREENANGEDCFYLDDTKIPYSKHCADSVERDREQMEADKSAMEAHIEWITRVRSFPGAEDFLYGMEGKMREQDPEGWERYSTVVRKTAEMLLGFNLDLVNEENREGIEDLTGLQGLELQDKISELIDSDEFSKACIFEDKFVISECDRVGSMIQDAKQDVGVSVSLETTLNSLYRQLQVSREERALSVRDYNNFYRNFSEGPSVQKDSQDISEDSNIKTDEEEEVK